MNALHDHTLERVNELMSRFGFLTGSLAYHDVWDAPLRDRIRLLDDPTSLCIRTRSDMISIGSRFSLKYEVKTRATQEYRDIQFEALPYFHHLQERAGGVRCLYFWSNPEAGQRCAFLAGEPQVSRLIITARWIRKGNADALEWWAKSLIPGIEVERRNGATNGSDDAYLRILEKDAALLPDWESKLAALCVPPAPSPLAAVQPTLLDKLEQP